MKKTFAFAALGLLVMSAIAFAGERRGGDAALGALSGAVVFGPVGALAGALVGFTAGPGIAQSWGLRSSTSRHARRLSRPEMGTAATVSEPSQRDQASPSPQAQPEPRAAATPSTTPPVQTLE